MEDIKMFTNCLDAELEFEKCWNNPKYTTINLDDVDVNKVLTHYITQKPIHFTKTMLWDMERKKAWNPGAYIPYVIKQGSAKAWNKNPCPKTGGEIFVRYSDQKKWADSNQYETVYEEVYVNEDKKRITFLGVTQLPGDVKKIHPTQSLFHVQHGAAGDEDHPKNTWRIVHLTEHKDNQLIEIVSNMNDQTTLPGFIQAYIENDLHNPLQKK